MISLILPVYNAQKTLARTIDSVLSQSCRDYELLIVDDGSSDASGEIAQSYAVRDKRVRVQKIPHTGVSFARNQALEKAQGTFVAFIDADDYLEETHLQTLLDTLGDCDLAVCGYHLENELTQQMVEIAQENPQIDLSFTHIAPISDVYRERARILCGLTNLLESDTLYPVWNKLYRREILQTRALRFDQTLRCWGEDELFNFQYLLHCNSIACTGKCTYFYTTQDENALNYQFDDNRWSTERRLHKALSALFAAKGGTDRNIRRLLAQVYAGKLILTLENDLHSSRMSRHELIERWEDILGETSVVSALNEARLQSQFTHYLSFQLSQAVFLPSLLARSAGNHTISGMHPAGYLFYLLMAVQCITGQDPRFFIYQQRALAAGAPWPVCPEDMDGSAVS